MKIQMIPADQPSANEMGEYEDYENDFDADYDDNDLYAEHDENDSQFWRDFLDHYYQEQHGSADHDAYYGYHHEPFGHQEDDHEGAYWGEDAHMEGMLGSWEGEHDYMSVYERAIHPERHFSDHDPYT